MYTGDINYKNKTGKRSENVSYDEIPGGDQIHYLARK